MRNDATRFFDPYAEHDACGIGAIVDLSGKKSCGTVDDALRIVESLSTARARTPPARPATASA